MEAESFSGAMQQNAISCDVAVGACGEGCEWPQAVSLLAEMTESTVQLNGILCSVTDFDWHRGQIALRAA